MEIIDTHCHIHLAAFDADRGAVLARTRAAGVAGIVVPGVTLADLPGLLALCRDNADLYPALGLHPVYLHAHGEGDLTRLRELIERERPVAVGEIGLDFFVRDLDPEAQCRLFEAQVDLARAFDLPVLLHLRKSHDRALAILRRKPVRGGIAHAFNGSRQQAEQFIAMGFKLGFGGVVTFERSKKIRRLAADLPLEALVLETDAPDLTPASHYGERNSPEFLPEVLQTVAELRGEDPHTVAAATTRNARELLGLP